MFLCDAFMMTWLQVVLPFFNKVYVFGWYLMDNSAVLCQFPEYFVKLAPPLLALPQPGYSTLYRAHFLSYNLNWPITVRWYWLVFNQPITVRWYWLVFNQPITVRWYWLVFNQPITVRWYWLVFNQPITADTITRSKYNYVLLNTNDVIVIITMKLLNNGHIPFAELLHPLLRGGHS